MKKQNGITLIALIITIIVLLILAGITISLVFGDNGVLTNATKSAIKQKYASYLEETNLKNMELVLDKQPIISALGNDIKKYINIDESDIEKFVIIDGNLTYIGSNVEEIEIARTAGISINTDPETAKVLTFVADIVNHDKQKQGIELADRTGSSTYWAIVTEIIKEENKINKRYGTGYYYLEAGTELYGNVITNSYVIDYNNKSIINCKENEVYSYGYLDINSSLGVTDSLIFNLDAKNILNTENWGQGISLYKYDETIYPSETLFANAPVGYDREEITDVSNYIKDNAFLFNGNNYIEIYNEEPFDFSEGLTFEFYGKMKGNAGPQREISSGWYTGLFGMWDGETEVAQVRFGMSNSKWLWFNFASAEPNTLSKGSHSNQEAPWNQAIDITEKWNSEEEVYFSITLNKPETDGGNAEYNIYINGEKYIDNGWINNAYWNGFLNKVKNLNLNYFDVGRCPMSKERAWSYLIGETYTMRIYNRCLEDIEVMENYNKTLSYSLDIE